MKLKERIRNKLVQFIMLDQVQEHLLQEINRLDNDVKQQDKRSDDFSVSIQQTNNGVRHIRKEVDILHNTINNVASVGADVCHNKSGERSWAVVCIEGNYNVVKFVDLHGADYRRMLDFLKQYEGSRMVVDAPHFTYFEDVFKMK